MPVERAFKKLFDLLGRLKESKSLPDRFNDAHVLNIRDGPVPP
jgi:hypothetical protein